MVTKYTNNLYASEVYRSLERQEAKKGFFDPTDEDIIKSAAAKVGSQIKKTASAESVEATGDLDLDIVTLASAMRAKGLDKQADDIESCLVMYKQARSNLYDVTVEKNKDFIEFAHRDGDKQIVEGLGEGGVVETIQSAAEKIRAMVAKDPKGNLPKEASLAKIVSMIKTANDPELQKLQFDKDYIVKTLDGFIANLNEFLKLDINNLNLNTPAAVSLFNTLGGNSEVYNNAVKFRQSAFQGGAENQQTIIDKILANPAAANSYVAKIGNYKVATLDADFVAKGQDGRRSRGRNSHMSSSTTTTTTTPSVNEEAVKANAQSVAQQIMADWNKYLYAAEAEKSKAKYKLDEWKAGTQKFIADLQGFKAGGGQLKSPRDYLSFAISIVNYIGSMRHYVQAPNHALHGFVQQSNLNSYVAQISESAKNFEAAAKGMVEVRDKIEQKAMSTLGRVRSVEKKFSDAINRYDSLNNDRSKSLLQKITTLKSIMRARAGGGEQYLLSGIAQVLGKNFEFDSFRALDIDTQELEKVIDSKIQAAKEAEERG